MKLSERLRELRLERKLSQNDIAAKLNISASAYGFYEQGKSIPNATTLEILSNLYDVSIDYLMGKSNIRNPYDENNLPDNFETPEEAVKFILEDNTIMGFGGFDINKFTDEEKVEFANELLNHIKFLAFKRNEEKNK